MVIFCFYFCYKQRAARDAYDLNLLAFVDETVLGLHLHGGQYNVGGLKNSISFLGTDFSKLGDYRFQGWFGGAGLAY